MTSKIICPVLNALYRLFLSIDNGVASTPEWYKIAGILSRNLVLLAADVPCSLRISTSNFSNLLMLLSQIVDLLIHLYEFY